MRGSLSEIVQRIARESRSGEHAPSPAEKHETPDHELEQILSDFAADSVQYVAPSARCLTLGEYV